MDGQELRRIFLVATAFKEGDLAVGGATDDRLREDSASLGPDHGP